MNEVRNLSCHDLQRIVESIQTFFYVDRDDDGRQIWNPEKEWSLGDACDHVANLLSQHDLVPEDRQLLAGEEQTDLHGGIPWLLWLSKPLRSQRHDLF